MVIFNSYVKLPEGIGSEYCNIFISMLDGEWWYHDNIWQHDFLKVDVLPNQLMAMPYGFAPGGAGTP